MDWTLWRAAEEVDDRLPALVTVAIGNEGQTAHALELVEQLVHLLLGPLVLHVE
jgi:hypothetical protein